MNSNSKIVVMPITSLHFIHDRFRYKKVTTNSYWFENMVMTVAGVSVFVFSLLFLAIALFY